jgi:hypothetical protein
MSILNGPLVPVGLGVGTYVGVLVETGGGVVESAVSLGGGVVIGAVLTAATYEGGGVGAPAETLPTATHATDARTTHKAEYAIAPASNRPLRPDRRTINRSSSTSSACRLRDTAQGRGSRGCVMHSGAPHRRLKNTLTGTASRFHEMSRRRINAVRRAAVE